MSDLNDFFAKKDRKKKKAAAKSALAASQRPKSSKTVADPDRPSAAPQPTQRQQDDGWIEIDDPKGSQVNTGGRTVVEFRRGAEEKEVNGDGGLQAEKFIGWAKVNTEPQEEPKPEQKKKKNNVAVGTRAFPTLADAAKVKHTPKPRLEKPKPASARSLSNRPRIINTRLNETREKFAERAAAPPR